MTFPRQIYLLVLSAFLGLVLVGCQPSDPDSPSVKQLTSIAVTPNPVYMEIGGFRSLTVTGTLTDNSTYVFNSGIKYASSATAVATVAEDSGYVTAVGAGSATITATHTASGKTATTSVSVSPLRVLSIAVLPNPVALAPGGTWPLVVTATYNNLTNGDVTAESTFVSSDVSVATVDATGVVTAVANGNATITATHTASGKTGTTEVTVSTSSGGSTALISFDEVPPVRLTDFGTNGAPPVLASDPANAANKVLKVFKYAQPAPGSEQWAGTTISKIYNAADPADVGSIPPIPFTESAKTMTALVWSPAVGVRVRLKVENASNSGISCETDAITTKSGQWETLTFDFAKPGTSPPVGGGATSPLDLTKTYNRLSIFMDFGLGNGGSGPLPADRIYYVDDINFVGAATAPTDAPTTVIPAGSTTVYSDAATTAGFDSCPNWGQATVCEGEQTIANNKSLKYTNLNYQGLDWASSPLDVSGKSKLHIDFWSPDLTSVKVSIIGGGKENAFTQSLTTGSWNSVDIDLSNYTAPDKTAIIQIKLESTTPGTLYVDNIYFGGTAGGGGGTALVFASNYSQVDPANWTSDEGGAAGTYIGPSAGTEYWWNGVARADTTPSFYFGYGINSTDKPWGFGAYVKAPGNGIVDVSGRTNLKLAVWGNDELMNTKPTLTLILKGPTVGGCTSELKGSVTVAAPGVQKYTVALSSFTLQTACAYASAAAALAAGVTEVHIQVLGDNVQYVAGGAPPRFPNGLNVGPISFE